MNSLTLYFLVLISHFVLSWVTFNQSTMKRLTYKQMWIMKLWLKSHVPFGVWMWPNWRYLRSRWMSIHGVMVARLAQVFVRMVNGGHSVGEDLQSLWSAAQCDSNHCHRETSTGCVVPWCMRFVPMIVSNCSFWYDCVVRITRWDGIHRWSDFL